MGALLSPGTAIVDYATGGTPGGSWTARVLVVCARLQSDRMARLAGAAADFRILPFRGEYFRLPAAKNRIARHLIYPAPDPELPFFGIHLTGMIDGGVTVGPNADLCLVREGYPKLSANIRDAWELLACDDFWKLPFKNYRHVARRVAQLAFETPVSGKVQGVLSRPDDRRPFAAQCRNPALRQ